MVTNELRKKLDAQNPDVDKTANIKQVIDIPKI